MHNIASQFGPMKNYIFLFIAIPVLLGSCQKHPKTEPSFYYWKTVFNISAGQENYLNSLKVKTLYLRYCDFEWNEEKKQPVPLAIIKINSKVNSDMHIIPVYFISNKTMEKIPDSFLNKMAKGIISLTIEINQKTRQEFPSELQMDCDWTGKTKQKYFKLLYILRQELTKHECILSATIRLHQVKFSGKTGIPPVDKGLLMFYNMGRLQDESTENSILDLETASQYLDKLHLYPLKLDIGLPLYSWAVVYRRGRPVRLINMYNENEISDCSFFSKKENHKFTVNTNTYFKDCFLYRGDLIRFENVDMDLLRKSVSLIKRNINGYPGRLVFFHLDEQIIEKFNYEDIKNLCPAFN